MTKSSGPLAKLRRTVNLATRLLAKPFSSHTPESWFAFVSAREEIPPVKVPKVRVPKPKLTHETTDTGLCVWCKKKPKNPNALCSARKKAAQVAAQPDQPSPT